MRYLKLLMMDAINVARAAVLAAALALLAAGAASADTTTGLVAYLPFSGNALDVTGNGYNGTVYGATLTTDRFGNAASAYHFDGNDHIELAKNFNFLSMTNGVTLSAWVKSETTNAYIFHQATGGELFLYVGDLNKGAMGVHTADDRWALAEDPAALPARYINVTGIYYPGNRVEVWVGGVLQDTTTTTGAGLLNANWNFFYANIGAYHEAGHGLISPFKGSIDEFRVYNRVLSGDDIRQLSAPDPVTAIPEPVTMAMMGMGIAGLGGYVRRRMAR
jgi:hypothetical protein